MNLDGTVAGSPGVAAARARAIAIPAPRRSYPGAGRRSVAQVIAVAICLGVGIGVLQWLQYRQARDELTAAVGRRAMKVAQMVVLSLEPYRDEYFALDQDNPAVRTSPEYERLQRHLRTIHAQLDDVRYVYTEKIFPERGYLVYLLDATPPEQDDFSPIGEKDYDVQDKVDRTAEPGYDRKLHEYARWGPLLTGWAPIFDRRGAVHSYAAVDIDAKQLATELAAVRRSGLVTVAAMSVVLVAGAWLAIVVLRRRYAQLDAADRWVDELRQLALHDELTELPNRVQVIDYLQSLIDARPQAPHPTYLLYVDLDGFKDINDRHGHATGDQLLIAATRRMSATVRATDVVARLSGDEFLVVLPEVETETVAVRIAEKLVESMAAPVQVQGAALVVTASVGIAQFPRDGRTTEELLAAADAAMYQAKRAGKNKYWVASARATPDP